VSSGWLTPSEKPSATPSAGSRPPAPGGVEKRALGVQRIRLDHHAFEVQLSEELFEHRPLVVLTGGVASLADCHAQGSRKQRHLGNERGSPTGCWLDRASQGLAVTNELIKIRSATWDLGDCPVADAAQSPHIHLAEEVAEGRNGGRTP